MPCSEFLTPAILERLMPSGVVGAQMRPPSLPSLNPSIPYYCVASGEAFTWAPMIPRGASLSNALQIVPDSLQVSKKYDPLREKELPTKTPAIRRLALRDTGDSRHHGGPIEGCAESLCTSQSTFVFRDLRETFNLSPIMTRDARVSDRFSILGT